jgi:elongation factor P
MISTGDLKRGLGIEVEGQIYQILGYEHIKMGRGGATVRIKMRNLRTGAITERTFDNGARFPRIDLDRHTVQYQYNDGDTYYFMDTETFEQLALNVAQLGDAASYLKDDMQLDIIAYGDEPLSVELPDTVTVRVSYTEPGFKGDTASGASKPATLENGLVTQVPLFVNIGDVVRIKTDTGAYVERVLS